MASYNAQYSFNYPDEEGIEAPNDTNITEAQLQQRVKQAVNDNPDWTSITIIITRAKA